MRAVSVDVFREITLEVYDFRRDHERGLVTHLVVDR